MASNDITTHVGVDVGGNVDADTKEAEKKIDALGNKPVIVNVDADTSLAEKKIAALGGKTVNLKVDATEAKEAAKVIKDATGTSAKSTKANDFHIKSAVQVRDELVKATKDLQSSANTLGGTAAKSVSNYLGEVIATLENGAVQSVEEYKALETVLEKIAKTINGASPKGIAAALPLIDAFVSKTKKFKDSFEQQNGFDIKVKASGVGELDKLNNKLNVIKNVQGLDSGLKSIESALSEINDPAAKNVLDKINEIKNLLKNGITDDNLARIRTLFGEINKEANSLSSREVINIAPQIESAQSSFAELNDSVHQFGTTLRNEFDASSFATAALNGDIAGLTRGFVGLAAGAKVTGAAIKTALASTVVLGIVMAVTKLFSLLSDYVKKLMAAKEEAAKFRLENAVKDMTAIEKANDNIRKSLQTQQTIVDGITNSLNEQLDATEKVTLATLELNKVRAMKNANTLQAREEIEADYERQKLAVTESNQAKKMDNTIKNAEEKKGILEKELATLNSDLEAQQKTAEKAEDEFKKRASKVAARGGWVSQNPDGEYQYFSPKQIADQIAYNQGVRREGSRKLHDLNIPQEAIDSFYKNMEIKILQNGKLGEIHYRYRNGIHGHDADYYEKQITEGGYFDKFKEATDKSRETREQIKLKQSEIDKTSSNIVSLNNQRIAEAIQRSKQRLSPVSSLAQAENDNAIKTALQRRASQREMEDATAYDSQRFGILQKRIAEEQAYADRYMNGGLDEAGNRVKGIKEYQTDIDAYTKASNGMEYSERRKYGDKTLTEAEIKLADEYEKLYGSSAEGRKKFDDMRKAAEDAAKFIPPLRDAYNEQEKTIKTLTTQVAALAKAYRDRAQQMQFAEDEAMWQRDENKRQNEYNRMSETEKDVDDNRRLTETNEELSRYDAEQYDDIQKNEMISQILKKRDSGEELTEAESKFKEGMDKYSGVTDAEQNELHRKVQNGEASADEIAKYNYMMQYRTKTQEQQTEFNRNRDYARNTVQQTTEAITARKQQREIDNEARLHQYAVEDEEYERGKAMRRLDRMSGRGAAYRYSAEQQKRDLEQKRYDEESAKFSEADAIKAAREGDMSKLNALGDDAVKRFTDATKRKDGESDEDYNFRMRKYDIQNERTLQESRGRMVSAREAIAGHDETLNSLKMEKEDRKASFDENIGKESNRLTQMGLGGGATVDWQRNQARDIHEMVGLSKEHLKALRDLRGGNSQRISITSTTWTMK